MVLQDPTYDETSPWFPSTLATIANIDYLSNKTVLVHEFLRRYHRADTLILSNSKSLTCSLAVLCRARPMGLLSLMRHIALFKFHLVDIGPVQVSRKARERRIIWTRYSENKFIRLLYTIGAVIKILSSPWTCPSVLPKANSAAITIPLDGFCSYESKIHKLVPVSWERESRSIFYALAASTYYQIEGGQQPFHYLPPSSFVAKGPTSPFSCLVEEIFRLEDKELQYAFIQVLWFERLVLWKINTFARRIYLTRVGLPNLLNVVLHLLLCLFSILYPRRVILRTLAGLQAAICAIWTLQKLRQARGTFLFFRSIFNYTDLISIALSITMVALCCKGTPPRPFIAYSMPVLWINLVLMTRVFEPAGTLMILVTEMIRGVFPFLLLLALLIIGFSFIPFLLLHGLEPASSNPSAPDVSINPFNSYSRTLGQVINFMANEFDSLDAWKDSLVSIQILQSLFTVVVSILLLNVLIALLNLKVEAAQIHSRQVWLRQMLILLLETELGLLTDSERKDKRYFQKWFTYTVTETERRAWETYVLKNKLGLDYSDDDNEGKNKDFPTNPTTATSTHVSTGHEDRSSNKQQENEATQMDPLELATTTSSQPVKPADEEKVASPTLSTEIAYGGVEVGTEGPVPGFVIEITTTELGSLKMAVTRRQPIRAASEAKRHVAYHNLSYISKPEQCKDVDADQLVTLRPRRVSDRRSSLGCTCLIETI
ncbi:hypothetical protein M422DRAFT_274851 [Sphaerobolus stellatus SS14]|uniref:Ion transport domain-containing protein n=1 Tax=Sphaerobolus stellatus (strain SS14) TaxID=990650 RepID=A0A0C9UGS6_SPHS4|nr:hypothetical protein M422DRAFT_274851 [Sphaerobolus stellatus SS14]